MTRYTGKNGRENWFVTWRETYADDIEQQGAEEDIWAKGK